MYIWQFLQNPTEIGFILLTIVIAVTVHEAAHAWAADHLGDPTARLLGRKSLNPVKHLDPIGSIMFLLAGFGWGKPVPVDSFNLRDEQKDNALIALAGPVSNIALAALAGILFRFLPLNALWEVVLFQFAYLNVSLAVFNLLPIPPLDGSKLYRAIFPSSFLPVWRFLDQYGIFILFFMFVSGANPFSGVLRIMMSSILNVIGF